MRKRIAVLCVLAATLAISLFGVPLAAGVARYYLVGERGELERVAAETTVAVSSDLGRGWVRGAGFERLPEPEGGASVALYAGTGARISGTGPDSADAAVLAAMRTRTTHTATGDPLVVAVPVVRKGRVLGVVRAARPSGAVYLRIAGTWLAMLGIAVLAVGLTWLAARRQARRLALPIERLATTAELLGEGDFTVRTRPSGIPEIDSAAGCLDATARRIGALLARERAFSAEASHQLRTPLTGLRLGLEAALQDPPDEREEAIRAAIASADRLERTIADLLALARDTPRVRDRLDAGTLLAETAEAWCDPLAERDRTLRTETVGTPPVGAGSAAAVRQILAVLVDNASQHGSGAVTLRARDASGVLAIDVVDEGDTGTLDTVELFRRERTPDGHGIGLPMARGLAEAEGGRLTRTGHAPTTFTLLLPAADEPE
ncbi:sensor histidine kinase [Actinomadura atramentaria]|uniref:sensor histidine kinase n=1 Tax=Actinomadura atramentaria TaxID=1990 RepID=UPI00037DB4D9|nr:HAMP domain-containing sensor histidine kinase [Actinomadura atramentaria]